MTADGPSRDAWLAFEQGRLEDADRLWTELIDTADDEEQRDRHMGHRAYVLVAQGRYAEARAVYQDLLERRPSHRYVHQLGMVEREAGELGAALRIFDREAEMLPEGDALALGANLYERALIHHLLGEHDGSVELMEQCLAASVLSEDPTLLAAAHRLRGDLHSGHDAPRARAAYLQALDHFTQAGDELGVAEVERKLASLSP